jgi:hypothetical protein
MTTAAVIGLGILVWVLLAILLALFVGRITRLRDRQRPDRTESAPPAEGKLADVAAGGPLAGRRGRRYGR